MKDDNNKETIPETLDKCGIIYDLTLEEMGKIAREELIRERVREYIKNKDIQTNKKTSQYSGISGIFYGPILFLTGALLLPTCLGFLGGFLLIIGIIGFLTGIVSIVMLVFNIIGGILNIIIKHS